MNGIVEIGPLTKELVSVVAALASDPLVSRTSGVPMDCDESTVAGWAEASQHCDSGEIHYVIYFNSQVVGCCILKKIDWVARNAELAFWIGSKFWCMGLASSAAKLTRDLAFECHRFNFLHSHHLKSSNSASGAVLHKLGFEPDEQKPDVMVSGRFADLAPDVWTFSILYRDKWAKLDGLEKWRMYRVED